MRFLDFEFAGCYSLFLDAAYATTPFPTCWCVLDTPAAVTARIVAAYRRQVVGSFPELTDDAVWEAGMTRAHALWTTSRMRALARTPADTLDVGTFEEKGIQFPGRVVQARFRLERFLDTARGELPSLTGLLGQMRDRLVTEFGDEAVTMPVYPAFRA